MADTYGCPKAGCEGNMKEHEKYKLPAEPPNMGLWVKVRECGKCHYAELYVLSPRPR